MQNQTLIIRHYKENKRKCTLQPLVGRENFSFYTYPLKRPLPSLDSYVLLTLDSDQMLSKEDSNKNLLMIDATWKYAERIYKDAFGGLKVETRALPSHFTTAYPRRQPDCQDKSRGLASIEALYIAYHTLGWDTSSLLDHYHFKDQFLKLNSL